MAVRQRVVAGDLEIVGGVEDRLIAEEGEGLGDGERRENGRYEKSAELHGSGDVELMGVLEVGSDDEDGGGLRYLRTIPTNHEARRLV